MVHRIIVSESKGRSSRYRPAKRGTAGGEAQKIQVKLEKSLSRAPGGYPGDSNNAGGP